MEKGLFIGFEGPDGSGKSTVCKLVVEELRKRYYPVVATREPGGTPISEALRNILLDPKNTHIGYEAEALMYAAARAQHIHEKIKPALEEGNIVITDRFIMSSLAYQGHARNLGMEEVFKLSEFAVAGTFPDLVLFFDVNPEVALSRKFEQNEITRFENESVEFHKLTYEGYKKSLEVYGKNTVLIDANGSVEETLENCMKEIDKLLGL